MPLLSNGERRVSPACPPHTCTQAPSKASGKGARGGKSSLIWIGGVFAVVMAGVAYLAFSPDAEVRYTYVWGRCTQANHRYGGFNAMLKCFCFECDCWKIPINFSLIFY